ncbi:type VII secretion protein EccB [Kitasatospora viridis]|uniref:Type VII secretion protein EccB n=1 Tax=Kitasatospora viridis TaxID=281105 RepID=A0A561UE69_9ACTN|nr:type VII secretion protein EccB [Kitasatospora viridis]TWF97663.1 type VII secretion protein EccB [Kitasatospora viridis]
MASRRDELNAYTFARKRTVGAFLQPEGGGSDEDAPRPVRALVPSLVVGALVMAGFGLWGMIKPGAPVGWDSGKNVIVGKDSTTRYVLLTDQDGTKRLHPVVNMASAKLVLPADSSVVFVADSVLDQYKWHGATIGIPFAPDKLPTSADAAKPKTWSVCDRPGADASHPNQSVFLAADADAAALASPTRVLTGGQNLYVQVKNDDGSAGPTYLVDPSDTSHQIGAPGDNVPALQRALFGNQAKPETVTAQWLGTLHPGTPITFPSVKGMDPNHQVRSSVPLSDQTERVVGRLFTTEQRDAYYVLGSDHLYKVSAFQAQLMQLNPATQVAYSNAGPAPTIAQLTPKDLNAVQPEEDDSAMQAPGDWPAAQSGAPLNSGDAASGQPVICSTFKGTYTTRPDGTVVPDQTVWAGPDFPAPVTTGANTAHVSAGHGLFYRAMDNGNQNGSGSNFLITETGLRYSVPANSEGTVAGQSLSPAPSPSQQPAQPQVNEAQARLGYQGDTPVNVPKAWSDLIPAGPALNTNAATQEQNS